MLGRVIPMTLKTVVYIYLPCLLHSILRLSVKKKQTSLLMVPAREEILYLLSDGKRKCGKKISVKSMTVMLLHCS